MQVTKKELLNLLSASVRAKPFAPGGGGGGITGDANTLKVEPFHWTVRIVTGNHSTNLSSTTPAVSGILR